MKQEYYIKFNTNADSKGLDELSRKSVSAKSNFEGLRNTITGMGGQVANLTATFLGLGGAVSAISLAQKGIEESATAKGNIIDFKRHSYGNQYAMEFTYMAEKLSKEYKLSRTNMEKAFYKGVQNKDVFESKDDIVEFMTLSSDYAKATGGDILDITDELLKIKKMGGFSTKKMRALLDQITAYEDAYGIAQSDLIEGLKFNLEFMSEGTDAEGFLNLYSDLIQKSGSKTRASKTFQSFLLKRDAIKKSKDNSGNAMAKLVDKKTKEMGVGIEDWKKMDDVKAFQLLMSTLDFENESEMELFAEAVGDKEAQKLKNKKLKPLDMESYANNLRGEVEKAREKEGVLTKAGDFFSKAGGDIARSISGQDAYSIFKESQKAEIQKMREQGYQSFEIDSVMRQRFNEETSKYEKSQTNNNTITTTINIDGSKSPKETGQEVKEVIQIINSNLEQKLNKN